MYETCMSSVPVRHRITPIQYSFSADNDIKLLAPSPFVDMNLADYSAALMEIILQLQEHAAFELYNSRLNEDKESSSELVAVSRR